MFKRTLVIATLAIAATGAGIGTAALSLSVTAPAGNGHVGDRYFAEPAFRPAGPAIRDTWYLERRGAVTGTDRIRDTWYRE